MEPTENRRHRFLAAFFPYQLHIFGIGELRRKYIAPHLHITPTGSRFFVAPVFDADLRSVQ